jgi:hypothetical protein
MADLESIKIPDYSKYLVKHLEYAKRFNPKMNDEAKNMLTEFFTKIRLEGFGSNRVLNTLYRLAKAVARLKLKDIVDEEDAKDVMSFYNVMLQNFQMAVNISTNPKDIAYNEIVKILQNTPSGITIPELCKIATENNKQVKVYLGDIWSIKNNKKLRRVIEEVLNHSNIKKIGSHPIVLQWLSDHSDHSDLEKIEEQYPDLNNLPENGFHSQPNTDESSKDLGSPRSPRSPINEKDYPPKCYRCDFKPGSKIEYNDHCSKNHPNLSGYPNMASLEKYGLEPQGMDWEVPNGESII